MRWLTGPEVAEHLFHLHPRTFHDMAAAGELDGIVTKRRGSQLRYHPEAAWWFACHGTPAPSIEDAYAWAEAHPMPEVPHRGARLVTEAAR